MRVEGGTRKGAAGDGGIDALCAGGLCICGEMEILHAGARGELDVERISVDWRGGAACGVGMKRE